MDILTRDEIVNRIKKNVMGQDQAVQLVAHVAHLYTRKLHTINEFGIEASKLPPLSLLLTGPTGYGKTFLIRSLANILGIGYTRIDMSAMSSSGWAGANLSEALVGTVKQGPGIIHLDEIDKINIISNNTDRYGAVSQRQLQEELLSVFEGMYSHRDEKGNSPYNPEYIENVVNNSFIICSGSFQFFREQEELDRKKASQGIGFIKDDSEGSMVKVEEVVNDLKKKLPKLGFIPELANRITAACELKKYSKEEIKDILLHSENNAYSKYINLRAEIGEFELTEKEIDEIVNHVHENCDQGLRLLDSLMFDKMFEKSISTNKCS
jgi:ATP-dependent protease Clp ATPase subunit